MALTEKSLAERRKILIPGVETGELPEVPQTTTAPATKTSPFDMRGMFTPEQKKAMGSAFDSVFGPKPKEVEPTAEQAYETTLQDMFNNRRKVLEKEKTDSARMAKFNALGNALTTLVQPLGWAAGGSTAGVQPYDSRQYIDAFNRALKASEDMRNLGFTEDQYRLKRAEGDLSREIAYRDAERKEKMKTDEKLRYADQRNKYTISEIEARGGQRLNVERFKAATKLQKDGKDVGDALQQRFYTEAARAWRDYVKAHTVTGDVDGMMTQEEFMDLFTLNKGYTATPKSEDSTTRTDTKENSGDDFSEFKRDSSSDNASPSASGDDFSQYKRN